MPLDLRARRPRRPGPPARRVRPVGPRQPAEDPAAREPLRRAAARARGRVDLMRARVADGRRRCASDGRDAADAVAAGRQPARTGRSAVRRRPATTSCAVHGARRRRRLRPRRPHRHRRRRHAAATSWPTVLGAERPGVRARSARSDAPPSAASLATGLSGHRRLRLRAAARPRARGAVRHRRRPAGEGRGPDGEERERLRPARGCWSARSAPSACSCR